MFKATFYGHNKILGSQKIGENCPQMPSLTTGVLVKQTFRTWMKALLHYVFG